MEGVRSIPGAGGSNPLAGDTPGRANRDEMSLAGCSQPALLLLDTEPPAPETKFFTRQAEPGTRRSLVCCEPGICLIRAVVRDSGSGQISALNHTVQIPY